MMSIPRLTRICAAALAMFLLPALAEADHLSANDPGRGGQGSRVEIYDHGLQVPIYQFQLPPGWHVNHYVATDVTNVWRYFSAYVIDLFGPYGEVSTALFPRAVYPSMGENWEQVWLHLFHERVGQWGNFQMSATTESPLSQALFPKSYAYGIPVFERSFAGTIQGVRVDGKLFAVIGQSSTSLIMYPSVLLAPEGRLPATIDAMAQIAASHVEDPRYARASQEVIAFRTQQHQLTMQSNRDWFAAHTASMNEASQMQSQDNRAFSASLGNAYTTNDRVTDYLRDTTTFMDPWSGQRVTQMGQYEYWFTDGLGSFIGSNNPNYEPSPLTGDWSGITPLGQ